MLHNKTNPSCTLCFVYCTQCVTRRLLACIICTGGTTRYSILTIPPIICNVKCNCVHPIKFVGRKLIETLFLIIRSRSYMARYSLGGRGSASLSHINRWEGGDRMSFPPADLQIQSAGNQGVLQEIVPALLSRSAGSQTK